MAKYIDNNAQLQDAPIDGSIYRLAQEANMSVEDYINMQHPVRDGDAPAFTQMMDSLGLHFANDNSKGVRAPRLIDVLDGRASMASGPTSANTRQANPESQILFPAAILPVIEDKLARDMETAQVYFDRMVAHRNTIPGTHFTRIITNYERPEEARNSRTAQLARPQNMMLLTASERQGLVPTYSLGLEWSDQVAKNTTIDFIALSLARQIQVQRDADAQDATIALLNGDPDIGQGPIPAQYRRKAGDYDSSITVPGKLTQAAWVKYLYDGGNFRKIDWIVTDIDTALAIENREGKPVIAGDDARSPRIDSQMRVANPLIPAEVMVFVTRHPDWPEHTIMGFQQSQGIQLVRSLSADYNAVDRDSIRRANTMRWDSGSISYRLYDEAFLVLELVPA